MAFLAGYRSRLFLILSGGVLLAVLCFPWRVEAADGSFGTAPHGSSSPRSGYFYTDPETGDNYMGTVPKPPQDYGQGEGSIYPGNVYPEIYVGWPWQGGSGSWQGNHPGRPPGWQPGRPPGNRPGPPGGHPGRPSHNGPGGRPGGGYPGKESGNFHPERPQGQGHGQGGFPGRSPGLAPGGPGGPEMKPPGYAPSRPNPSPQSGPGGRAGRPPQGMQYPSPMTRP